MNMSSHIQPAWVSHYAAHLRFMDGGRDGDLVDCFGFARLVYLEQLGIDLPAWPKLTLDHLAGCDGSLFETRFTTGFNAIEMGCEQVFDIAVIRRPLAVNGELKRGWWHLGVVTRPAQLAHMDPAKGVVEECFRSTSLELASSTLRTNDVRLFRYHTQSSHAQSIEVAA